MASGMWIKPNETSRTPNRWVWFDTEAREVDDNGTRVQTWRLGCARADWLNEKRRTWQVGDRTRFTDPEGLWDYVAGICRPDSRTIAVAHNLGYDVRISRAIPLLRALGFTLVRWQVSDQACVLRWRRDNQSLWLVDSYSWLPKGLGEIGSLVKLNKTDLPATDATEDEWWARCEADVDILRAAMLPLVKWVRDADLGNWQSTSGSMAWANWRHRHYTHPVLVHDDQDAREAERSAAYTGRCEAWKHGRLAIGEWFEWDFPLAYPRICLDTPLPTILRGRIVSPSVGQVVRQSESSRFLVYAEINTPVEVLPYRRDNRISWPIGTFEGWYWDRELLAAQKAGATIRPVSAYRYSAAPALAQWAETIIDMVESTDGRFTPIQQLAAKTWARALIGRFGTRYWAWEDWGDAETEGVQMDWLVNYDTRDVGRILRVAGRMFGADKMSDGTHSVPAIMSAIMSECRIRLWEALQQAGAENVAYMDTDSLIVNDTGRHNLCVNVGVVELYGIRQKSKWKHITVIAPRQLILDQHHRVSGVSRGATRTGPYEWQGERWEGLTQAAENGRDDRVIIRPTRWELTGIDNRRQHLDGGQTLPFTVSQPQVGR